MTGLWCRSVARVDHLDVTSTDASKGPIEDAVAKASDLPVSFSQCQVKRRQRPGGDDLLLLQEFARGECHGCWNRDLEKASNQKPA
jgi:hypothetical protein